MATPNIFLQRKQSQKLFRMFVQQKQTRKYVLTLLEVYLRMCDQNWRLFGTEQQVLSCTSCIVNPVNSRSQISKYTSSRYTNIFSRLKNLALLYIAQVL